MVKTRILGRWRRWWPWSFTALVIAAVILDGLLLLRSLAVGLLALTAWQVGLTPLAE
jgi:hypothetical protein